VIGFYGPPLGPHYNGSPAPADVVDRMRGRLLGILGGADESIPPSSIATFKASLTKAGVDHRLITYAGAPHSFFDRKAADYADASSAAWNETMRFVREAR
jgi:carboxymethylenebutenolidase